MALLKVDRSKPTSVNITYNSHENSARWISFGQTVGSPSVTKAKMTLQAELKHTVRMKILPLNITFRRAVKLSLAFCSQCKLKWNGKS